MSDASQANAPTESAAPNPHLQSIAATYEEVKRLAAENAAIKIENSSLQNRVLIADTENELLRKQIKTMTSSRDHFMRAFTALAAELGGIARSLGAAVLTAERHGFAPAPEDAQILAGRPFRAGTIDDGTAPPRFILRDRGKRGATDSDGKSPADLAKLADIIAPKAAGEKS